MLVLCFLKSQTYTLCYCPSPVHTHTHPCTNTFQKRTLRHGTTTACYFATIHLEATKELCQAISMPSHYNNISLGNTLPLSKSANNNRARVASYSGFSGILEIGNEITYVSPSPTHPPTPTHIGDVGQRALVGKVNMDQQCPDTYCEDTKQSLQDTRR